jgi:hypothetical protein
MVSRDVGEKVQLILVTIYNLNYQSRLSEDQKRQKGRGDVDNFYCRAPAPLQLSAP